MKIDVQRENVRSGVMECLTSIVEDAEYGVEHKAYAIYVPITSFVGDEINVSDYKEVITKPARVYRQIVLQGKDFVADVYTNELLKKIQCKQ